MQKKSMYLISANVLVIIGLSGISMIGDHGHTAMSPRVFLAILLMIIISMVLYLAGITAEAESAKV